MSSASPSPSVVALRRWLHGGGFAVFGLLLVIIIGLLLYSRRLEKHPPIPLITVSAGTSDGTRAHVARMLIVELARRGIPCQYSEIIGSEAVLDAVDRCTLDLAFVQGGLKLLGRDNVHQIASLYVEPLHLAVKEALYPQVKNNLASLEGHRVNLGGPTTGTIRLAAAIMSFAGLAPGEPNQPGRFQPLYLDGKALTDTLDNSPANAPDATFLVSTQPSSSIQDLVSNHGYQLVDLPFAKAFRLGALVDTTQPTHHNQPAVSNNDPPDTGLIVEDQLATEIQREYIYDTTIPPFTYRLNPPVPDQPIHTLGTRLLLVGRQDLDPHVIEKLLDTIFSTRFVHVSDPPLDMALLQMPNEFPVHQGTTRYLNRNKPLITGDVLDLTEKWTSIAGVSAGGLFFLWQWLYRRSRLRREKGFESYILKVADIERQALALEVAAVLDLAPLLDLQHRLAELKQEALGKLASGEIYGDELMNGFLSHISDSRDYLARLILHQRENLEQAAEARGLSPRSMWPHGLQDSKTFPKLQNAPQDDPTD